ncbi:MAG: hypothetical protein NUV91_10465, partial [Candidatus Omnitrophica bacterium]|nr:hypothetical protein [Candidatus Omnitrophota bacterium]
MKPFFSAIQRNLTRLMETPPRLQDSLVLSIFAILITLQPYFLHGKINIFELGIYLPGIQAFLHGALPYRDFFHLRGPLEIYVPTFLMNLFGESIPVLYSYFYIGTIFTLILSIVIAKNLFKTRFVLYVMVPVFVARTFPRVVFHIWGGMRYALGLLVLLLIIY